MTGRFAAVMAFITILAYAWPARVWFSADPTPRPLFQTPLRSEDSRETRPFFSRDFINPEKAGAMVHAGSICEMPEGDMAAVWYGGTREGARDVAIFFSKMKSGQNSSWSAPRIIVDRKSASAELRRYIGKVGNSILWSGPDGKLWLVYVTISIGGWSGSSLNVKTSLDGGRTWSRSRRFTLSPFFNISELVKARPVAIKAGGDPRGKNGFAVPIYHECLGCFPEILWIEPQESHLQYTKSRMAAGPDFLQPSIAVLDPLKACALYRCISDERRVAMASTGDCGQHWSRPAFLNLPNPNSAVSALPLAEKRILLAFNDSQNTRETLRLAVSRDHGRSWTRIHTLEQASNEEFSYPYMIRGQDGRIHLVYTWKRKRIRHVVFNEAWIDEQLERAQEL